MLLISVKRREDTTHKDIAVYLSRLKITKDLANFVSYSSNVNIMQDILCSTLFCSKTCGIGAEDRKDSLNELSPSMKQLSTQTIPSGSLTNI